MTTTPSLLTAEEVAAPAASGVPEEAARVLAQLARHQHVRGCIALTASDLRVIWSGGVVFASKEKLAQIVHFVRDTLNVTRRHYVYIQVHHEELCSQSGETYVLVVLQDPNTT
ncbi:hypothetical protein MGL_3197 [Malassezia globosa CBS 7966]|uniref:Roadblock/LAMTOR2 domain-containing protein n=1 Tax=Malassezia globosa (strain ATCC MYA-4612 / CBS 7966) TaxID=425265 RepID=A8Q841_MALGO|nr:uncharacterized protein MGL_3197 [Malassezia globosa CBS 7966]EDP42439.1 hypothetical protein MGL_3197 [Malassezia globosa CBS 7966]